MARFIGKQTFDRIPLPLKSGDVAAQGVLLFGDPATGKVTITPSATTIVVGHAMQDMTGDGTSTIDVQLPREITTYNFTNDSGTTVSGVFKPAYCLNGSTATGDDTLPLLGMTWQRSATIVAVEIVSTPAALAASLALAAALEADA